MDQLICASLSHTHYWYEVGMLKVPYSATTSGGTVYEAFDACAGFEIQVLLPKSFMKAMFYSQARQFLLTIQLTLYMIEIRVSKINPFCFT